MVQSSTKMVSAIVFFEVGFERAAGNAFYVFCCFWVSWDVFLGRIFAKVRLLEKVPSCEFCKRYNILAWFPRFGAFQKIENA